MREIAVKAEAWFAAFRLFYGVCMVFAMVFAAFIAAWAVAFAIVVKVMTIVFKLKGMIWKSRQVR